MDINAPHTLYDYFFLMENMNKMMNFQNTNRAEWQTLNLIFILFFWECKPHLYCFYILARIKIPSTFTFLYFYTKLDIISNAKSLVNDRWVVFVGIIMVCSTLMSYCWLYCSRVFIMVYSMLVLLTRVG